MDTVLFNTFSTIAATFGSAVGIIVAAGIFRLQKVDQIAAGLATELMKYHSNETQRGRLNRIIIVQDWDKFIKVWNQFHAVNHSNEWERRHKELLEDVQKRIQQIRDSVRRLVSATLILIGFCFVGLATTLRIQQLMTWDLGSWESLVFNVPAAIALVGGLAILILYRFVTYALTTSIDYGDKD